MPDPQADVHADKPQTERPAPSAAPNGPQAYGETRSFRGEEGAARRREDEAAARTDARRQPDAGRSLASANQQIAAAGAEVWSQSMASLYACQAELLRWFDTLWRENMDGLAPAKPWGALSAAPWRGLPPVDIKAGPQSYTLCMEAPGLTREDVEVSVDGQALRICGRKLEETREAPAGYRLSERRFGQFERSFPLPADAETGAVEASMKDGLLKVVVPRSGTQTESSRRVDIRS